MKAKIQPRIIKADFPEKTGFLFETSRYKVLMGGRGGSKSWACARALLVLGMRKPLRILCARETQRSISDSVHKLLCDQIAALDIAPYYQIQQNEIRGYNGTKIIFAGLRQNISNLKSYESVDICWVEEAQVVSKHSWEVLIPTIRKDGSEIWVSFNPELESDDTYRRFIQSPPPGCQPVKLTWRDNPWFPSTLRVEMEYCKQTDTAAYEHIWEGKCILTVEGAVFAAEMRRVDDEQRITKVPYNSARSVETYWDLGDRFTSIWFAQSFPFETRLIDYFDSEGLGLDRIVKALQLKQYVYGTHWLPFDARMPQLGTGRTIEEQLRSAGFRVQVVPKVAVHSRLNMLRLLFPQLWFDGDKCADGIQALRHYRWAPDGAMGQIKREPLHDINSHACLVGDSLVKMASGYKRIDSIQPGEYVWTPAGNAEVLHAGMVKKTNDLITVKMSDGRMITGTPEHKIFTKRGLICMDALRYTDRILGGQEWQSKAISLFSRVMNIGFRELITDATIGAKEVHAISIGQYGRMLTDQFQKVSKSITKILIPSTMTLGILRLCPNLIIPECIRSSDKPMESLAPLQSLPSKKPQNGMGHQKELNGIDNTASIVGKIRSGLKPFALCVVSLILRRCLHVPSIAQEHVLKMHYEPKEASRLVYDLTCAKHACYQANGILVSNSDALSYCAVVLRTPSVRTPPLQTYRPYREVRSTWS